MCDNGIIHHFVKKWKSAPNRKIPFGADNIEFIDETTVKVTHKNPISSVTCGQEAVFYDGEVCLGGGVIDKVYVNDVEISDKIKEHLNAKR